MKHPIQILLTCSLALTLLACREQTSTPTPAQVGDVPEGVEAADTNPSPPGLAQEDFEKRLAGVCRITKISEGNIPLSEKPVFAITEAPPYGDDFSDNAMILVRDTPDTNYEIIGKLPNQQGDVRDVSSSDLNNTPFILCSHETINPSDGETCWYLNEEGWYGALSSYGTQGNFYLIEARTLELIAHTQLQRPGPGCPETWTLPGNSREQVRDAGPIDMNQIRNWLNGLS
ncbi:hypothetical protein E1H12_01865 [Geitlerinema sp. P-1104]|uniref:hypothetical protein n=1 Tax=Geitlerinema sp. P-1104 TaxID=2546230 RepID=UPI001476D681|nr:hypothetical protein [Geitlerinema sp. P-1104]NMG57294.1 hypothetical protein [Geitlerinema sp. P-1104]